MLSNWESSMQERKGFLLSSHRSMNFFPSPVLLHFRSTLLGFEFHTSRSIFPIFIEEHSHLFRATGRPGIRVRVLGLHLALLSKSNLCETSCGHRRLLDSESLSHKYCKSHGHRPCVSAGRGCRGQRGRQRTYRSACT